MSEFESYTAVGLDGTIYSLSPDVLELTEGRAEPLETEDVVRAFKASMRMLATGVVMVTSHVDRKPWGLTISACCSVSLQPPQLLISLARHTTSFQSIRSERRFGVSILTAGQRNLAEFGASPGSPKFLEHLCEPGDSSEGCATPLIVGSLCHLDCKVRDIFDGGDHAIILGRVEQVVFPTIPHAGEPLIYFDGKFHSLGEHVGGDVRGYDETEAR